jgi:hypothetical protein
MRCFTLVPFQSLPSENDEDAHIADNASEQAGLKRFDDRTSVGVVTHCAEWFTKSFCVPPFSPNASEEQIGGFSSSVRLPLFESKLRPEYDRLSTQL